MPGWSRQLRNAYVSPVSVFRRKGIREEPVRVIFRSDLRRATRGNDSDPFFLFLSPYSTVPTASPRFIEIRFSDRHPGRVDGKRELLSCPRRWPLPKPSGDKLCRAGERRGLPPHPPASKPHGIPQEHSTNIYMRFPIEKRILPAR